MVKIARIGEGTPDKTIEIFKSPNGSKQNQGWNCIVRYAEWKNKVALWMQFTDLDSMEELGWRLVEYARGNK